MFVTLMKMAAQDGKGSKVTYTSFQKVTSKWLESNLYIFLKFYLLKRTFSSSLWQCFYDQSFLCSIKKSRNMTIGGFGDGRLLKEQKIQIFYKGSFLVLPRPSKRGTINNYDLPHFWEDHPPHHLWALSQV